MSMSTDPRRVETLFRAAIDRAAPGDRAALLDRECGADVGLRGHLAALLAAAGRPDAAPTGAGAAEATVTVPVDPPTGPDGPGPARDAAGGPSPVGTVVAGRYRVGREIGEGGMGTVYLAEQVHPVRREVALKLIRAGMDSRGVLARFEAERQALAIMDHPHIARVLDAGTTASGHPFFVMELVRGVPLTDYCDRRRLALPERLRLFREVCGAVQHAHQKGVIHRDLKPSNILVEEHDGRPVPKVIDFGLAKAVAGHRLGEQSALTALGAIAGTPLYMAPEQARLDASDVDTRADIYALGVILYELLTGSTPIRREAIRRAAVDEILRVVREVEPPAPSSRIGSSDSLPSLAAVRGVEPSRLGPFVRGDLDWIVMKALAKERGRRYDSAVGLADDVGRFLNDEPVLAGPPTARYRLHKFVVRNRLAVVVAAAVLLAVLVGSMVATLGLVEARRQERLAVARAAEADAARRAEAEQRGRAEGRLAQLERANDVLGGLFRDLDPRSAGRQGRPVDAVLGERLDRAAAAIEGESIGDPVVVARTLRTLAEAQMGLGRWEQAVAPLDRARATFEARLGADHPDTLATLADLATAWKWAGRLDLAVPLAERSLEADRRALGPDHPDTLAAANNLASAYQAAGRLDRAVPLLEQTLAAQEAKLGAGHRDALTAANNLAFAQQAAGRLDLALPLFERALDAKRRALGADHPETLIGAANLASAYHSANQLDRALPLYEQALAGQRAKLGPDHPHTLISMVNLATGYQDAGQLDRAIRLLEQALQAQEEVLGADHPDVLTTRNNLAFAYQAANQLDRAVPLFERTVADQRDKLGADHPTTLSGRNNLALAYQASGQIDRAIPIFEQTLAARAAKLGADHPDTRASGINLAAAYQAAGQPGRAIPPLREVADSWHRSAPDSPQHAAALAALGLALLQAERWPEAEPVLRDCLAIRERTQPDAWSTFNTRSLLGGALLGQGRLDEAAPLLRSGYEGMRDRAATIPPAGRARPAEALDRLIRLAEATNRPDDAEAWRRERAKLVSSAPPPDVAKP